MRVRLQRQLCMMLYHVGKRYGVLWGIRIAQRTNSGEVPTFFFFFFLPFPSLRGGGKIFICSVETAIIRDYGVD